MKKSANCMENALHECLLRRRLSFDIMRAINNLGIMSADQNRVSATRPATGDEARRCPANHNPYSSLNRRRFLACTSACFLGAAGVSRTAAGGFKPIDIGPVRDFARDGISEKFIQNNFFVIRHKGRIFATIATCPHKGNYLLLDPKNPSRIICSGHDAVFSPEGLPASGKVRQGLARFGISLTSQGRVLVNPDQQFAQNQWNTKGSFVAVQ